MHNWVMGRYFLFEVFIFLFIFSLNYVCTLKRKHDTSEIDKGRAHWNDIMVDCMVLKQTTEKEGGGWVL